MHTLNDTNKRKEIRIIIDRRQEKRKSKIERENRYMQEKGRYQRKKKIEKNGHDPPYRGRQEQ